MAANDWTHAQQRAQLTAQPIVDDGVLLDLLVFLGREPPGLEEQTVGNAELSNVMKKAAALERREILFFQPKLNPERRGVSREALAVAIRRRIARFDRQG